MTHWTADSPEDFEYAIKASFFLQLDLPRAYQHLSLRRAVKLARERGLKIALVIYNDDDPTNALGPINGQVVVRCWEMAGKPRDFFDLAKADDAVREDSR